MNSAPRLAGRTGERTGGRATEKFSLVPTFDNIYNYIKSINFDKYINEILDREHSRPIVTLSDIPHHEKYISTIDISKYPLAHIGQLKLFLTEVQFLNDYRDDDYFVVYAGSAPSNKLPFLISMFPRITWILVDPNEHFLMHDDGNQYDPEHIDGILYFSASRDGRARTPGASMRRQFARGPCAINTPEGHMERGRFEGRFTEASVELVRQRKYPVYIAEEYFTVQISKWLSGLNKVLFINDIRTNLHEGRSPTTFDIYWNTAQSLIWTHHLDPVAAMHKFKTPYFGGKYLADFTNYYGTAPYADDFAEMKRIFKVDMHAAARDKIYYHFESDTINIQAYAGPTSTESRLIYRRGAGLTKYDSDEYEDKFFWYNRVARTYYYCANVDPYKSRIFGLDGCGDCGIMIHILEAYDKSRVVEIVNNMLSSIHRKLTIRYHGYFQRPFKFKHNIIRLNFDSAMFNYCATYIDELGKFSGGVQLTDALMQADSKLVAMGINTIDAKTLVWRCAVMMPLLAKKHVSNLVSFMSYALGDDVVKFIDIIYSENDTGRRTIGTDDIIMTYGHARRIMPYIPVPADAVEIVYDPRRAITDTPVVLGYGFKPDLAGKFVVVNSGSIALNLIFHMLIDRGIVIGQNIKVNMADEITQVSTEGKTVVYCAVNSAAPSGPAADY